MIKTYQAKNIDFDLICGLEKEIFPPPDQFSKRQLRNLFFTGNADFLLCSMKGDCVGYGITLLNRLRNGVVKGRIYSIGILKSYQGKGAGSILLKAMEKILQKSKIGFITLETKKGRLGATLFFQHYHYHIVNELPGYYSSGDGVRMRKDIKDNYKRGRR